MTFLLCRGLASVGFGLGVMGKLGCACQFALLRGGPNYVGALRLVGGAW